MARVVEMVMLYTLTFQIVTFTMALSDLILPPNNLTVLSATKTRASLYWIVPPDTPCILRFELTYDLVDSPFGRYSVTRGIHGDRRKVALVGLIPCQRYRVFMVSIGTTGTTSNFSNEVEFTTTAESLDYRAGVRHTLQIEEVIIIFLIVIVWIIAVSVFIRKWDNIRILEPMEPRYKHAPKNLENVRIVKRAQDSVIYKNYSRKLSFTMDQREKRRLERLNTVPQIGTLPTIQMEEVTEM
ncbi:uncharacterized protein [Haliotis cracherodii]|uniref:uncharacterized protein isoform X2 n=1 Tax=Haliotis cracherodii TaxID=6455 RepID=UPI0039EC8BBE